MFSLSKHWISESLVIAKVSAGFQILLVGTKSDLKNSDQRDMPGDADISKAEGDQLAKEIKATCYMETSSKTGDGIKEVFDAAMKAAMGEGKKGPKYCILIWFLLQINGFQWRQKIKKSLNWFYTDFWNKYGWRHSASFSNVICIYFDLYFVINL